MTSKYLDPKPRYEILDGLRGVAAILVLIYHHAEMFDSNITTRAINHGHLAVDFFFILSGFVIGYAYDDRWNKMSTLDFFKRRLVRLHPMIIFATLFCMVFFYYGMGDLFPFVQNTPPWQLIVMMILSMLMIPATPSMDIKGWAETNPINGNAWTLYLEYFANILYALVIRHFPNWLLVFFVAGTAVLNLDLTLNIDMFGVLANRHAEAYSVVGGWTTNLEQGYIGLTRLLYPFFAGLLLSRIMADRIKKRSSSQPLNNGFWLTALFLTAVLVMPRMGGSSGIYNGMYEALAILVLFPLIVWIGAKSTVSGLSAKLCKWLGDISYPLYITHYCLIFGLLYPWHVSHPNATTSQLLFLSIGNIMLSIFIAHAALKLYDEPVRKWLTDKWLKRRR